MTVIFINMLKFNKIFIVSQDEENKENSYCFFIPFLSIIQIKTTGHRTVDKSRFYKQLEFLEDTYSDQMAGILISLKELDYTYLDIWNYKISENFDSNPAVAKELLKAKRVDWIIGYLDDLLKMQKLAPDNYSRINYSIGYNSFGWAIKKSSLSFMDNFDFSEFQFSSIWVALNNSLTELIAIAKLISSRKTRFSVRSVKNKLYSSFRLSQISPPVNKVSRAHRNMCTLLWIRFRLRTKGNWKCNSEVQKESWSYL